MNSYPVEFLSHPQPLMFIGGLGTDPVPRPEDSEHGPGVPLTSPDIVASPPPTDDDEFTALARDLRSALAPFTNPQRVWCDPKTPRFRTLLVDKGVRLPLRKAENGHSPLSPLTPTSPLFPDGLIAPVWVRKHAELIPSVFVLFLRLYETPARGESESPLGGELLSEAERQRERDADEQLVREIAERRRRLGERGVKLTVVLMATAATLDTPGLDQRLSQIRRASSLSAKASLFVLTPVPSAELPEFVRSLMDALIEPALEYYAAHGKRVRRKRGRAPHNVATPPSRSRSGSLVTGSRSRSGSIAARPLTPQGWTVRYDWKAGWFAEVRGELDLARRHYEDCWNELAKMFGSTSALPPRTKRWAEAKVLADCLAIRICKLLLYENAGQRVLIPFFVHVRRFTELSRGWGIGEETFEFWSWVARQYRVFGEMLEIAQQQGFNIPTIPSPTYAAPTTPLPGAGPDEMSAPVSTVNPLHVLQPPAFYFYTAATCSIERKARFDSAVESTTSTLTASPGFASEKTVDHTALIIELLAKAHDLLKGDEDSGLALYIAYRTAMTYAAAGQHERALGLLDGMNDRFTERPILRELQRVQYECARATGAVETAVKLLVAMLPEDGEHAADLATLLKTTQPSSEEVLVLDGSMFDARIAFRGAESPTGSTVPFQITISSLVDMSAFEFSRLRVSFSDARPDVVITNGGLSHSITVGTVAAEGSTVEAEAALSFKESLILSGEVSSDLSCQVAISDIVLSLVQDAWNIDLRLDPKRSTQWTAASGATYTPVTGLHSSLVFNPRSHDIAVEVEHSPSAYVGETIPVTVQVTSNDDRELDVRFSALLRPGSEPDGASITIDDASSDSLLKDIHLGTLSPGSTLSKVVHLHAPEGTKILDISVLSSSNGDENETTKTAVIPFLAPFDLGSTVHVSSVRGGPALVSAVLTVPGPRAVVVEDIKLVPDESVQLLSSSLAPSFPQTWDMATSFAISARFTVQRQATPPPCGALHISWYAVSDSDSTSNTTVLFLPPLIPPPPEAFVTASLSTPALVRSHKPFIMSLTLNNAHPNEQAYLTIQGDTADGFVWSGPRAAQVGPIAPSASTVVEFSAVPVGAPGWLVLPHVSVWLGHDHDRREVRVSLPTDRPQGSILVQP